MGEPDSATTPAPDEPGPAARRLALAAAALFLTQGFSRVTMGEIAAELGMSKKTMYRLYASKEDLLLAAIDAQFDEVTRQLDAILDHDAQPFPDQVRRVLGVLGRLAGGLQGRAIQDIRRSAPAGWQRIEERRRQVIVNRLARLLQTGRAAGMVRGDLHPDLLVLVLLALVERVAVPDTLSELPVSIPDVFHTITTVFFEGVLSPTGRTSAAVPSP